MEGCEEPPEMARQPRQSLRPSDEAREPMAATSRWPPRLLLPMTSRKCTRTTVDHANADNTICCRSHPSPQIANIPLVRVRRGRRTAWGAGSRIKERRSPPPTAAAAAAAVAASAAAAAAASPAAAAAAGGKGAGVRRAAAAGAAAKVATIAATAAIAATTGGTTTSRAKRRATAGRRREGRARRGQAVRMRRRRRSFVAR